MDKPDALRLADELAAWEFSSTGLCGKSAAELRRLSAENAMLWGEREEPHAKITMYIGEWYRLETERDTLLEALQDLCDTLGECGMTEKARAAIKAVEEGK